MKSITEEARAWGGQEYDLEGNLVDTDKTIGFTVGATKYINKALTAFRKVTCELKCGNKGLCQKMVEEKCREYNLFLKAMMEDERETR